MQKKYLQKFLNIGDKKHLISFPQPALPFIFVKNYNRRNSNIKNGIGIYGNKIHYYRLEYNLDNVCTLIFVQNKIVVFIYIQVPTYFYAIGEIPCSITIPSDQQRISGTFVPLLLRLRIMWCEVCKYVPLIDS